MANRLRLLPAADLVHTGPVDHADWNYRPLTRWVSRSRFRMVTDLLPPAPVGRLLEIGTGSGVFLPTLAQYCRELHAIDIHTHTAEVAAALARHGVTARLQTAAAESLPYPDGHFDRVVVVSSLEFVADLPAVCREVARVLAPGGRLVAVTPGTSPLLDFALKRVTGKSAADDFGDRRATIRPTLEAEFTVLRRREFPPFVRRLVPLYTAYELGAPPGAKVTSG